MPSVKRRRGPHAGASRKNKSATMAGTPPSNTRIVPVMAGKRPVSTAASRTGSRSLRQQVLKGEAMDTEALRIQCLEELRLYAAPIKGDGNCLFYTLSDQLYGHPDRHEEIRQRLVEHVRDKSDYFIHFVSDVGGERKTPRRAAAIAAQARQPNNIGRLATDEGQRHKFEQMLSHMGKNGFWGGSVELQAFCQVYSRDVMVYTDHGIQSFTSDTMPGFQERETVHVAYHSFEHYSSVRSIEGPHTGLPSLPQWLGQVSRGRIGGESSSSPGEESSEPPSEGSSSQTPLDMPEPWKIFSISEALPEFDHDTIRTMLSRCRGDIDDAFSKLLDGDVADSSHDDNSASNLGTGQSSSAGGGGGSLRNSPRPFIGSSSRSSSRHSTASKRSANESDDDDDDDDDPPRASVRPRRGRDRKRRILQDVTVGISLRDEEEDDDDVVSIRLRVDPDTVAERADGGSEPGKTGTSSTDRDKAQTTTDEEAKAKQRETNAPLSSNGHSRQRSASVSDDDNDDDDSGDYGP